MKTIEEQDPLIEPETTQPDHEPPPYASLPTIQDTGSTSTNPLPACDSRFADLIVNRIIMPRLRAGVLQGEDHETLEFVPRTRADVPSLLNISNIVEKEESSSFAIR
jgi:hypothetical protein